MMNVGFLGAGNFAKTMAEVVHRSAHANLYAVASTDVSRAQTLEPQIVFDNYEALLECAEIDIVYVLLSNDLHFPWVMAALAHGKSVICEKPLGISAEEVALMYDAADAADALLVEAYWHLWHPRFALAKSLISSGAIGDVISISSGFTHQMDFDSNFRSKHEFGGGMLLDLGCYPLSAATWLLDLPVFTKPLILENESNRDGVEMHVKATGLLGEITCTITASANRDAARWFEVLGTDGSLSFGQNAFSAAPEPAEGTAVVCTSEGQEQEWIVPASDPRCDMVDDICQAVEARRSGVAEAWRHEPSSRLSILTAHAIATLQNALKQPSL